MGRTISRMKGMKISVSLPDEDVAFLDAYAIREVGASRSAAVHRAVESLRMAELGTAYEEAFAEGTQEGDWDGVAADGLERDAPG